METLMNYDWPGNVRELRNITTYLLTLSKLPNTFWNKSLSQEKVSTLKQIRSAI